MVLSTTILHTCNLKNIFAEECIKALPVECAQKLVAFGGPASYWDALCCFVPVMHEWNYTWTGPIY